MNILISACLLGYCCRYDGSSNGRPAAELLALKRRYHLIPICPEQLFHGYLRAMAVIFSIVTRTGQKHKRGRKKSFPAANNI